MASDHAIETEDLTKVFRNRWTGREIRAVDGVSLQIRRGTTFGLLGPNGAGKTTFIKMLLSATHPSSGAARIFGGDARLASSRKPVGYLPENHRFPTYFTGAGMLDFYGALSGMEAAERRQRSTELLERLGLKGWGTVRIGKYSKGMLQRLGLAQAMMHKPALLVLDEPTDGVDPVGRLEIREVLRELERQGVTIFLNSHLLAEVETFCREVAILQRGKVALQGAVRDLTAARGYRVTAAEVPDELRNQLRATAPEHAHDGFVQFQFTSREEANQAVDLLRGHGCEIESLAPTTSTLEEVFVQTIEGKR
ncbi:MAG: ABC transporter ATP-binding protein [Bryobacteraceae bacterium]|nr:ABC transporter ATP-binding protein [Bryobacteraceae bacterium]